MDISGRILDFVTKLPSFEFEKEKGSLLYECVCVCLFRVILVVRLVFFLT